MSTSGTTTTSGGNKKWLTKEEREAKKAETEYYRRCVMDSKGKSPAERLHNLEKMLMSVDGLANFSYAWIQRYKHTSYLKQPQDREGYGQEDRSGFKPPSAFDDRVDGYFHAEGGNSEPSLKRPRADGDKLVGVTNEELAQQTK